MGIDDLSRIDLSKVGATQTKCLGLYPISKKSLQRVLVGDETGKVTCLAVKKGNLSTAFKFREKKAITGIEMFNDRAFVGTGNTVKGINKKGKEFYALTSGCTEQIQQISLNVPHLYMAGKYLMYEYNDNEEKSVYSCQDKIQAITQADIDGGVKAIVGCKDRMLRVVEGERDYCEIFVKNAVSSVGTYVNQKKKNAILYGTENGTVGSVIVQNGNDTTSWTIESNHNTPLTLFSQDYTKDGVEDIFVGRDNGTLEMYSLNGATPKKCFSQSLNESITGIVTGAVLSNDETDIIATTYSGKVIAFHDKSSTPTERVKPQSSSLFSNIKQGVTGGEGKQILGLTGQEEIGNTQHEIKKLKARLAQLQMNYKKLSEDEIAVHCKYSFKHKFILDTESASYRLVVELDIPIDMVALHGEFPIELLSCDTPGVVVSTQEEKRKRGQTSLYHTTLRCTQSVNRIEMNLRSTEGMHGDLELFVIPGLAPKISQMATLTIRPLSLHVRVNEMPNLDKMSLNEMAFTGTFSMEEIHGWLSLCLEDIPERVMKDEAEYFYKSSFLDTVLYIKCSRGNLLFKSDNASTISVLEGIITRQATIRKTRLTTNFKMDPQSYARVISLLYPKLEYQLKLSERVQLIDSLKEISLQEENLDYLDDEFKEILENEKTLRDEVETSEQSLRFLKDILFKLIRDCCKFKQQNVTASINALAEILDDTKNITMKRVISIFSTN